MALLRELPQHHVPNRRRPKLQALPLHGHHQRPQRSHGRQPHQLLRRQPRPSQRRQRQHLPQLLRNRPAPLELADRRPQQHQIPRDLPPRHPIRRCKLHRIHEPRLRALHLGAPGLQRDRGRRHRHAIHRRPQRRRRTLDGRRSALVLQAHGRRHELAARPRLLHLDRPMDESPQAKARLHRNHHMEW